MVRIAAPLIAKKVLPGQFIIFRLDEFGERVPLTVADYDREGGTITLIFQIAGETTRQFSLLEAGDSILDLVGPLGVPTELPEGTKSVCVIAVSYTHLDVYKRQQLQRRTAFQDAQDH